MTVMINDMGGQESEIRSPGRSAINRGAQAGDRKLRIILLDEEPTLRRLIGGAIRTWRQNVELSEYGNGDEVWRELSHDQPDVLITDDQHGGALGNVIVSKLAAAHAECSVLWTSSDADTDLTSLFGELKHEVLPKPFGREELLAKLNQLVSGGRAEVKMI